MNENNGPTAMSVPQMETLINNLREVVDRTFETKTAICNKIGKFNGTEMLRIPKVEEKQQEFKGFCGELQKLVIEITSIRSDLEIALKELSHIVG